MSESDGAGWKRLAGGALVVVGVALCLAGAWGIGAYVWGVIDVLDEPDRSWIFWGLALLLGGILAVQAGMGAVFFGLRWWRAAEGRVNRSPAEPR